MEATKNIKLILQVRVENLYIYRMLLLGVLSFSILLSCTIVRKEPSSFKEYLLQKELITPEEAKQIDTKDYISSLKEIYEDRMPSALINFPRKIIITGKIKQLIQGFHKYGIIGKETEDEMLSLVPPMSNQEQTFKGIIFDEYHALKYLTEREAFTLTQSPQRLRSYIQKLHKEGLVNDQALSLLSYQSPTELLPFIDQKLILDPKHIPTSAEDAYGHFFQKVEQLDSKLHIEDFTFETIVRTLEDEIYRYAYITFNCQGKSYSHAKSLMDKDEYSHTYAQILNRIFSKLNSSYRAISLEIISEDKRVLVLLTKDQYKNLHEPRSERHPLFFDSDWYKMKYSSWPEEYLSQEEIEKHFQEYNTIGLFSHLTQEQKLNNLKILKGSNLISPGSILSFIDRIFLGFDWEMSDANEPYVKAIQKFSSISRGEFQPIDIYDDFDFSKDSTSVGFTHRKKVYTTKVEVTGDWYSPDFVSLINDALADNGGTGRFYSPPSEDQMSIYIYLTKDQYRYLEQKGSTLSTFE